MRNLYKGSITEINTNNKSLVIVINIERSELASLNSGLSISTIIQLIFDETIGLPILSNANKSDIIDIASSTDSNDNLIFIVTTRVPSIVDINRVNETDSLVISIDSGDEIPELSNKLSDISNSINGIDVPAVSDIQNGLAKESTLTNGITQLEGDIIAETDEIKSHIDQEISPLAKESTLSSAVTELGNKIDNVSGSIDFTPIAKESTLTGGIAQLSGDIIAEGEEVKDHVTDAVTPLAKESTLTQGIETLSDKVDGVAGSIDFTPIAKESTLTSGIAQLSGDIIAEIDDVKQSITDSTSDLAKEVTLTTESSEIKEKLGDTQSVLDSINGDDFTFDLPSDYASSEQASTIINIVNQIKNSALTEEDKTQILDAISNQNPNLTPITDILTNSEYGLSAINSTNAKESSLSSINSGLVNKLNLLDSMVKGISSTMYKGVLTQYTTDTTIQLSPNIMYIWSNPVTSNLTINKGVSYSNIYNNYLMRFTVDSSNTNMSITFDWSINWYGGNEPTWTAGNTYEISIVDGYGLVAEYEPNTES